ncbi:unnamed protein product [Brachionus calyciflorus]|uniref:Spermatogenesis-associated protein 1 C-terminal domain-containing protein n=1 Tax=Brachionus calyciflorus TaxID=104777 RepID=A0A813UTX0_9BILA|nr:unnamed protein product [Brachionus calyciflorus]
MSTTNQYYSLSSYRQANNQEFENRPDSSKLVDLHVYILPRNFWKTKQKLAYNETILESVSAGFIRVTRDLLLRDLRNDIKKQCSGEDVPKDYVFLKSVGRALTRVKSNQENELKVKHFLPPQTIGPEVFLLEVDQEISYDLLKKFDLNPPIDFSNYLNHEQSLQNMTRPETKNSIPNINLKTPRDNYNDDLDLIVTNRGRESTLNYDRSREYEKMREEQERLRNRQIYLEQMRKRQLDLMKNNQPEPLKKSNEYPQDEDYLIPHKSNHSVIKEDDERELKEKSALIIQSAYRGYKDRERVRRLKREKALSIIEDTSETASENNDVDIFQIENSVENMREKIKKTKQRRIELETLRSDLLKHLKTVHNRITVRRKEARDLWKKRYFLEKKKTPELEEKNNYLLNEIQNLHQKMFASLESDNNNNIYNVNNNNRNSSMVNIKSTDPKIGWLESQKLEEEIYLLKRQIDQIKLKLATDMKLRIQAEAESKALKSELLQTRMNLLQYKNSL